MGITAVLHLPLSHPVDEPESFRLLEPWLQSTVSSALELESLEPYHHLSGILLAPGQIGSNFAGNIFKMPFLGNIFLGCFIFAGNIFKMLFIGNIFFMMFYISSAHWCFGLHLNNPLQARTKLFRFNIARITVADDLAPYIARTSAPMINWLCSSFLVLHREGIQLPVPC